MRLTESAKDISAKSATVRDTKNVQNCSVGDFEIKNCHKKLENGFECSTEIVVNAVELHFVNSTPVHENKIAKVKRKLTSSHECCFERVEARKPKL